MSGTSEFISNIFENLFMKINFVDFFISIFLLFLGAIIAFRYSYSLEKKIERYHMLNDTRKILIENHMLLIKIIEDYFNEKKLFRSKINHKTEYRMKFTSTVSQIQSQSLVFEEDGKVRSAIGKYTDLLVKMEEYLFSSNISSQEFYNLQWDYLNKNGEIDSKRQSVNIGTSFINYEVDAVNEVNIEIANFIKGRIK